MLKFSLSIFFFLSNLNLNQIREKSESPDSYTPLWSHFDNNERDVTANFTEAFALRFHRKKRPSLCRSLKAISCPYRLLLPLKVRKRSQLLLREVSFVIDAIHRFDAIKAKTLLEEKKYFWKILKTFFNSFLAFIFLFFTSCLPSIKVKSSRRLGNETITGILSQPKKDCSLLNRLM